MLPHSLCVRTRAFRSALILTTLTALAIGACGRLAQIEAIRRDPPLPPPSASAAPSSSTSLPEVAAELEEREVPSDPSRLRLYLVVPALSREEPIALVPRRFVCVASRHKGWRQRYERPDLQARPPETTSISCDPSGDPSIISLVAPERGIRIGDVGIDMPAHVTVTTGRIRRPARSCHEGAADPIVDVWIDRRRSTTGDGFDLVLSAPSIGATAGLGPVGSVDVFSQRYIAARRMTVTVRTTESATTYTLAASDDALMVSMSFSHFDQAFGDERGGWELPCQARVVFHETAYRHPNWGPLGGCVDCSDLARACDRPCFESLTNANGELTELGYACVVQCRDQWDACQRRTKCG